MGSRGRSWWVGGVAAWCGLFAALHVFWALGGNTGLASSAGTDLAERRPLTFVVFGLWGVAAALVAGAAMVCWAAGANRHRRWRVRSGWFAGLVGVGLVARGLLVELALATDLGGVRGSVGPAEAWWSLVLWNPWFVLGGALFLGAGVALARKRPPAGRPSGSRATDRASGIRAAGRGGAGHLEGPGDEGELER